MNGQFVVNRVQSALRADSFDDSKAMTRTAVTTGEINRMADIITYNKGASVLRMVEHTFGNDNFEIAFKDYLKNKYVITFLFCNNRWK